MRRSWPGKPWPRHTFLCTVHRPRQVVSCPAAIAQSSLELIRILLLTHSLHPLLLCSSSLLSSQISAKYLLYISSCPQLHLLLLPLLFSLSLHQHTQTPHRKIHSKSQQLFYLLAQCVCLVCVCLFVYVLPGTDAKCGPPLAAAAFCSFVSLLASP